MSSILITSGVGVRRAATILITKTAYLRFCSKDDRGIRPAREAKTMKTGSSKIRPKAKMNMVTKETNFPTEIIGLS